MSNYSGHDRPFPIWFPYALGGTLLGAVMLAGLWRFI